MLPPRTGGRVSERTRRSLQYAPADRPDSVERAAEGDADAVILDLESTVEEADKDRARGNLGPLLADLDFGGKETVVRLNGLDTERWLGDLEASIEAGADSIRLPKVERPGEVETAVEAAEQLADTTPEFLLQLETPRGILNGAEIATVCARYPSVTGIGVGIGDYTKSLGVPGHTNELRAFLLNQAAAVAAAGEMDALGYVHKELDDLEDVATMAKELGHVGQPVSYEAPDEFVAVLNRVYSE